MSTPEPPAPTPSATTLCARCGKPFANAIHGGINREMHAFVPPASAPAATAGNTNSVSTGSSLGVPAPTGEEAEDVTNLAGLITMCHDLKQRLVPFGASEAGWDSAIATLERATAQATELAALREALKFYATPANWMTPSTGFALQYDPEPSPISKDSGQRARAALAPRQTTEGHEHG